MPCLRSDLRTLKLGSPSAPAACQVVRCAPLHSPKHRALAGIRRRAVALANRDNRGGEIAAIMCAYIEKRLLDCVHSCRAHGHEVRLGKLVLQRVEVAKWPAVNFSERI